MLKFQREQIRLKCNFKQQKYTTNSFLRGVKLNLFELTVMDSIVMSFVTTILVVVFY